MRRAAFYSLTYAIVFISTLGLAAQNKSSNDVGLVIGATTTPSVGLAAGGSLSFNPSLALGAEYDRRVISRRTALYLGVDFVASPFDVKLSSPPAGASPQYAYVFLTPHARIKFNPGGTLEPWLLFGGGYARFREAPPSTAPAFAGGSNTGTLVFGGGVDTRPLLHIHGIPLGSRIEVRDFYSGTPNYLLKPRSGLQNSVVYTGGLLIRF